MRHLDKLLLNRCPWFFSINKVRDYYNFSSRLHGSLFGIQTGDLNSNDSSSPEILGLGTKIGVFGHIFRFWS